MFGTDEKSDSTYSKKIQAPIYEPKNKKPHLLNTFNDRKAKQLIQRIEQSSLRDDEKDFLKLAAMRHVVFHYETIADYYAHSTREMQELMEDSALVIIDFDKAIEGGFVKVCEKIEEQFMTENPKEVIYD